MRREDEAGVLRVDAPVRLPVRRRPDRAPEVELGRVIRQDGDPRYAAALGQRDGDGEFGRARPSLEGEVAPSFVATVIASGVGLAESVRVVVVRHDLHQQRRLRDGAAQRASCTE